MLHQYCESDVHDIYIRYQNNSAIFRKQIWKHTVIKLPGKKSFHEFVPINIAVKRCSEYMQHILIHDFKTRKVTTGV